jgi:hypothetical protein
MQKSFPIFTLKITPQTVLFNDEDFHSVEILATVVKQSEVLAIQKQLTNRPQVITNQTDHR